MRRGQFRAQGACQNIGTSEEPDAKQQCLQKDARKRLRAEDENGKNNAQACTADADAPKNVAVGIEKCRQSDRTRQHADLDPLYVVDGFLFAEIVFGVEKTFAPQIRQCCRKDIGADNEGGVEIHFIIERDAEHVLPKVIFRQRFIVRRFLFEDFFGFQQENAGEKNHYPEDIQIKRRETPVIIVCQPGGFQTRFAESQEQIAQSSRKTDKKAAGFFRERIGNALQGTHVPGRCADTEQQPSEQCRFERLSVYERVLSDEAQCERRQYDTTHADAIQQHSEGNLQQTVGKHTPGAEIRIARGVHVKRAADFARENAGIASQQILIGEE